MKPHHLVVSKVHQLRDTQMTFSISTKSFENPRSCLQFNVQILMSVSADVSGTPAIRNSNSSREMGVVRE